MKKNFLLTAILGLYLPFGFAAHNPHSVRDAFRGNDIKLMFEDVRESIRYTIKLKPEDCNLLQNLTNGNEDSQRQNRRKAIGVILKYSGKIANSADIKDKGRLLFELSRLLNITTSNGKKAWEILEESEDYGIEIEPESGKIFCRQAKEDTLLHAKNLTGRK